MLFLAKPSLHEHPASRDARKMLLATQDFEQAYRNFPKQLRYERLMLACLAREPNDYVGAFCRLPTKLRELFLQAYQSYLFNKSLSRRIAVGHRLDTTEVGDHVVSVERSGLPMVAMHKMVSVENRTEINGAISAGKMRLALPLVGFKQHLSSGAQGEIEKQIIDEEGISLKNFGIAPMPEISLRGGLRTAITPLKDFSLGKVEADPTNLSEHKAEVSFTLNRGSYATIILRELMKPRNLVRSGF
jgi:tRNA pseudouridine13 synthase